MTHTVVGPLEKYLRLLLEWAQTQSEKLGTEMGPFEKYLRLLLECHTAMCARDTQDVGWILERMADPWASLSEKEREITTAVSSILKDERTTLREAKTNPT